MSPDDPRDEQAKAADPAFSPRSSAEPRIWLARLGALQERNFRRFFIGQTTSILGSAMSPLAIAFAVLAHGNSSDLGYVFAAGTAPLVVFLLVGGVVADRLGRRFVMLGADVLRFAAQAALAGWVLVGVVPLWGFITLAALSGIGTGLFSPALTGLVPEVVSDDRLTQANAMRGISSSGASILGPALAGVIIATTSPGWAIAADAASYLVSVLTLASLQLVPRASAQSTSFVRELREGWNEFWARTWLWVIVVQFSLCNVIIFAPYFILGAVIAKQSLGGAGPWGAVLACQGGGAVLGGILMLRYRPARPLLVATAATYAWALPLFALGFRLPIALIAIGAVLGGFSFSIFGALWDTTLQRNVPNEVLSRVSAYDWLGSLVLLPIGEAVIGPIARLIGLRTTFVGAGVILVLAITVVLLVPSVTNLRAESEQNSLRPMPVDQ